MYVFVYVYVYIYIYVYIQKASARAATVLPPTPPPPLLWPRGNATGRGAIRRKSWLALSKGQQDTRKQCLGHSNVQSGARWRIIPYNLKI